MGLLGLVLVTPPALVLRILDEAKLLRSDPPGYAEDLRRVRHRPGPTIW
jgi:hypothetical protein